MINCLNSNDGIATNLHFQLHLHKYTMAWIATLMILCGFLAAGNAEAQTSKSFEHCLSIVFEFIN